jgi:SAM-dependent methyltransferase
MVRVPSSCSVACPRYWPDGSNQTIDAEAIAIVTDRMIAPPEGASKLRSDPAGGRTASLLPGLSAVDRTGLTLASGRASDRNTILEDCLLITGLTPGVLHSHIMRLPRAVRAKLHPVTARVRKIVYVGNNRSCSVCGKNARKFLTRGNPPRPEAGCPNCGSLERHRLATLYLQRFEPSLGGRLLHVAPEAATISVFRRMASEYVTTDLNETADITADITELPFPEDRWDFIVCSHVLEHVGDDRAAMREFRRVLAPGGRALVMVPRNPGTKTDEDPSITDTKERTRRFGQHDHVRIYGDDLEERLRTAGFDIIDEISPDAFPAEDVERYRLRSMNAGNGEVALLCGSGS